MKQTELLKNIPDELKYNCSWCVWKLTEKGKIPLNPATHDYVKSNNKNTFTNYGVILNYLMNYDGLGIGVFDDYSAIDIDDCVKDGKLNAMAQDIVDTVNSYTEFSPSGKGIRIIFKTNTILDKEKYYIHNSKIGLEIYLSGQTNKFVSITGNTLHINNEINTVDISPILNKYMLRYSDLDNALLHDNKLNELWNSTASGYGGDESETDLALCDKLAFYLKGDYNAIEDAFVRSPYYASKDEAHKKKWMRGDYRKATINNAIRSVNVPLAPTTKAKYTLTDTGNAHRFIDTFGEDIRYNTDLEKWMTWNGSYWEVDKKGSVRSRIEILAEQLRLEIYNEPDENNRKIVAQNINKMLNKAGKDTLLNEAKILGNTPIENAEFDKYPELLNTDSGIVNLRTGEILPPNKNYLFSLSTHHTVDMENEPKLFLNFLSDILENNTEVIHYIHKIFGYCATDTLKEQEMYIFYGDGSNGKSLLAEVIGFVLGDYASVARKELLTEQLNQNNTLGAIAKLKGRRFVKVDELEPNERANESVIKTLTSGLDKIVGRFLYANEFEFYFTGKIILPSNYLLNIKGTDEGIWRRIKVIPFNKKYQGKNNDKSLKEKLLTEAPQILGWIIKGAVLYFKEGLEAPQQMEEIKQEYRTEQDVVKQWMDERTTISNNFNDKVFASVLFRDYIQWCDNNNAYKLSSTAFGKELIRKGLKRTQVSNGRLYHGVLIKEVNIIDEREDWYDNINVED